MGLGAIHQKLQSTRQSKTFVVHVFGVVPILMLHLRSIMDSGEGTELRRSSFSPLSLHLNFCSPATGVQVTGPPKGLAVAFQYIR